MSGKMVTIPWAEYHGELASQFEKGKKEGYDRVRLRPLMEFLREVTAFQKISPTSNYSVGGFSFEVPEQSTTKPLCNLTKEQIIDKLRDLMHSMGDIK